MSEKILTLPRLGETMQGGTVLTWSLQEGDSFARGDTLLEMETDKMVVEVPALENGTLLEILTKENALMEIGAPLARVKTSGDEIEQTSGELREFPGSNEPSVTENDQVQESKVSRLENPLQPANTGKVRASPAARRIARRDGIDLTSISGSGPLGRVIREDVERASTTFKKNKSPRSKLPEDSGNIVETAGFPIHFIRKGPSGKTPLVFVHGFGGDNSSWRFNLSLLAREREVWSPDLPGHGASRIKDTPSARYGLEIGEFAEVFALFLALHSLNRVHLIGHSMGGAIALQFANLHPVQVASLTLLAPIGLGAGINREFVESFVSAVTREELSAVMHRLFFHGSWVNDSMLEPLESQRREPGCLDPLRQIAGNIHDQGRQLWMGRHLFDTLPMPVKVIWGCEDQVLPSSQAAGLPGTVAVHLFPETGHMVQIEQAMAVNRLIEEQVSFE